jgi:hypothetical protein
MATPCHAPLVGRKSKARAPTVRGKFFEKVVGGKFWVTLLSLRTVVWEALFLGDPAHYGLEGFLFEKN